MNRRFWQSLCAVLAGNLLYLAIERWLPPAARHQLYRIDWGMAVDFWLCVAFWGVLNLVPWFRR